MTSEERAKILMQVRGYIVLAFNHHFPIGHIVHHVDGVSYGGKLPQPFVIVSETDEQDALEQTKVLEAHGEETDGPGHFYHFKYYYRLTTD